MAQAPAPEGLPKEYWEHYWANEGIPAEFHPADVAEQHAVFSSLPIRKGTSFIEIGCAPGKWMAYFARQFQLSVSGVEYADDAYRKTLRNLQLLAIPATVHHADFLQFEGGPYDVVFSAGFIEHFADPAPVVERISGICNPGGIVITMIPSMRGVNRWISKAFRPRVAAGHFPIRMGELVALHEALGLHTLCVKYTGSPRLLLPFDNNRFSERHPRATLLLNLPFRVWNKLVTTATGVLGRYPRIGWISTGIVYVGQKSQPPGSNHLRNR